MTCAQTFPTPIITGQNFTFYLRVADELTDALVDFTGWTAKLVLRDKQLNPVPLAQFTTENAIAFGSYIIHTAEDLTLTHNIKVEIPDESLEFLRWGKYPMVSMGMQLISPIPSASPIQILINETVDVCHSIAP
jgi:hypothetical protein